MGNGSARSEADPIDASGEGPAERLTTQQVADRLGVKPSTVYAYASRGLLTSERAPGGKGSTFSSREIDALAERRQRTRGAEPVSDDDSATTRTSITLIENGRLYYRGVDAVELSRRYGFEACVGWLWGTGTDPGVVLRVPRTTVDLLRRTADALPPEVRLPDRLRASVTVAATADPLRFDLREENVLATGAVLIAAMVESLPLTIAGATAPTAADPGVLAERLWARLAPAPAEPAAVDWLNQALVLLADHDLAVSTVAARVAASARAHPYAVVSAGLGALDGPLHGAAGELAYRMLSDVLDSGNAVTVISAYLRTGVPVPGLGLRIYPDGDPRARALLASLERVPNAAPVLEAVRAVLDTGAGRPSQAPNVDLALAAFALATGMPSEAGEVIVAVARTAGWIAHATEEYREPPLRMRAHGLYVGPRPGA